MNLEIRKNKKVNKHSSLKHLFSRINIPNISTNKLISNYKNSKTIANQNINKIFSKTESNFTGNEILKRENYSSISNKSLNYNHLNSKLKGSKSRFISFNKKIKNKNKYSTNMTQTPSINNNRKKSKKIFLNSFRNKYHSLKIKKKNYLQKENNDISSHINVNDNLYNLYLYKNHRNNNICINSNINKSLNHNVIVDNNIDLLREIQFQTVNNFNNKYKLKFKTKIPKIHNKINDIFSKMKLYKYEEEKKIDAIITLANEKPKIKKKKMKTKEILFNEKDFQKNFILYEKDFHIQNKLKDYKKYVYIHTLDLVK